MVRAPFILVMAEELRVTIADIGNLFTLTAVAWGVVSLIAGVASDRVGRRALLIGSLIATVVALVAMGVSRSYGLIALWTTIAGGAGGVWMGLIFAEIADRVPLEKRGRAMGWVVNGQSLALALGVPLATLISPWLGWRGISIVLGIGALSMIVLLLIALRGHENRSVRKDKNTAKASIRDALNSRVLALLIAGLTERVCFGLLAVYLPAYLLKSYGVSVQALTIPLALIAIGNVAGNAIGARLADKLSNRLMLFVLAGVATAVIAMVLFFWKPGLALSVAIGCVYAFLNAVGRPALLATLSDVPSEIRGTVLGINMTGASFGWIGASLVGGLLIEHLSLSSLGAFAAAMSLLGAGLVAIVINSRAATAAARG